MATVAETLLAVCIALICLAWCFAFLYSIFVVRRITVLEKTHNDEPSTWPRLSVIIAARDEGATIDDALRSLIAQDYPNLEIIVVDDRSRDATGAVLARIASEHPRVVPLRIDELPAGWLGKVHALHRGEQRATGDWLLFTDADVQFAPGILRKAIALTVAREVDHLTVAPGQLAESFPTRVAMAGFATVFIMALRAHTVGRPGSNAFVGVGAFNLVRRTAFAATPGFEWLRMEVADDVGLGFMLQRAGRRSLFAISPDGVRLTWYARLGDLARGLEKNSFGPAAHYQFGRGLVALTVLTAVISAPFVALCVPLTPWLWLFGAMYVGSVVIAAVANAKPLRTPVLAGALSPLGLVFLCYVVARSGVRLWQNHGVVWRDTRYSLEELRAGQRVKL